MRGRATEADCCGVPSGKFHITDYWSTQVISIDLLKKKKTAPHSSGQWRILKPLKPHSLSCWLSQAFSLWGIGGPTFYLLLLTLACEKEMNLEKLFKYTHDYTRCWTSWGENTGHKSIKPNYTLLLASTVLRLAHHIIGLIS